MSTRDQLYRTVVDAMNAAWSDSDEHDLWVAKGLAR